MSFLRASHRSGGNAAIEGYQPAAILDGKTKQIRIGDLLWAENATAIEEFIIDDGDVVGPENVTRFCGLSTYQCHSIDNAAGPRITHPRNHADESILRKRATRPAVGAVGAPPSERADMMDMLGVEKREQHIHVE